LATHAKLSCQPHCLLMPTSTRAPSLFTHVASSCQPPPCASCQRPHASYQAPPCPRSSVTWTLSSSSAEFKLKVCRQETRVSIAHTGATSTLVTDHLSPLVSLVTGSQPLSILSNNNTIELGGYSLIQPRTTHVSQHSKHPQTRQPCGTEFFFQAYTVCTQRSSQFPAHRQTINGEFDDGRG